MVMIWAVSLVLVAGYTHAELVTRAQNAVKRSSEFKTVDGTVTWISKNRIAVSSGVDVSGTEHEMLLPIDAGARFVHTQGLSGIQRGDTVHIIYEEISEESEGEVRNRRVAREITFVRPSTGELPLPPDEARKQEARKAETGVLGSY